MMEATPELVDFSWIGWLLIGLMVLIMLIQIIKVDRIDGKQREEATDPCNY